jgi:hypothetical protein
MQVPAAMVASMPTQVLSQRIHSASLKLMRFLLSLDVNLGSHELNCVVRVVLSSYANTARLQEASIARGVHARLATKSLPLAMFEEEFYALNLKIAALEVQREPLLEQRLRAKTKSCLHSFNRKWLSRCNWFFQQQQRRPCICTLRRSSIFRIC